MWRGSDCRGGMEREGLGGGVEFMVECSLAGVGENQKPVPVPLCPPQPHLGFPGERLVTNCLSSGVTNCLDVFV
jgi:hypothetical protein